MSGAQPASPAAAGAFPDLDDVAYWRPDPALAPYVSGYHFYRVAEPEGGVLRDVFFPSWSLLRFAYDAAPWSLRIGRRRIDPVPSDSFAGPTSRAGYVEATRGLLIGAGVLPAGWARLFGGDLSRFADRVSPLAALIEDAPDLRAAVWEAMRADGSPGAALDRWFLDRLARSGPPDDAVERLFVLINDPAVQRSQEIADALALSPRALVSLSRGAFGFPPKLLLRRARFLRALTRAAEVERGRWRDVAMAAGYFDGSHFLRDCHQFLGRSLGEFLEMRRPLNVASMRRRTEVLGAPMQSLHGPDVAEMAEGDQATRGDPRVA